jgi:hypothetical protein
MKYLQTDAIQAFNQLQGDSSIPRILRASYDELYRQFETNKPYLEIAQAYGVSRQRIQQIYKKYFQPFMATPKQRMEARLAESNLLKRAKHVREIPKLEVLRTAVESLGLRMEPVATIRLPNRASHYFVDIEGHRCKVQTTAKSALMSRRGYRSYWRFNLTRYTLEQCEFNIFIAGTEGLENFFIVPSKLILETLLPKGPYKTAYIATQNLEPYNNQLPKLNFWNYHEAWGQLGAAI